MPSAQSCEPVRKTVNSLVLRVLPGHIYLLVNSQGNMQNDRNASENSVTGRWLLTHQGSGLWQKSSVKRLAKQRIHTFKHCLCLNPTHLGTRASWLPIRLHWINCTFGWFYGLCSDAWRWIYGFKFSIQCAISVEFSWKVQLTGRPWEWTC